MHCRVPWKSNTISICLEHACSCVTNGKCIPSKLTPIMEWSKRCMLCIGAGIHLHSAGWHIIDFAVNLEGWCPDDPPLRKTGERGWSLVLTPDFESIIRYWWQKAPIIDCDIWNTYSESWNAFTQLGQEMVACLLYHHGLVSGKKSILGFVTTPKFSKCTSIP